MDPVTFTVQGTPIGQPKHGHRAVFSPQARKWIAVAYPIERTPEGEPHPILAWREAISRAVRPFVPPEPWTGPVRLDTWFYFERPQYMLKPKWGNGLIWHDSKPDTDNLEKAVMDTLTDVGLWKDDGQKCAGEPRKWYAERGSGAGMVAVLRRLEEPAPVLPFVDPPPMGGAKLLEPPPHLDLLYDLYELLQRPANRNQLTLHNAVLGFCRERGMDSTKAYELMMLRGGPA